MKKLKYLIYVLLLLLSTSLVGCPPFPVIILTPSDGESFELSEEITFNGSARDLQDGELTGDSLVWTSSIDGQIGTGNNFTRDDLSKGIHKITLTATNSLREKGTATITIPIGEQTPPPISTTTTIVSSEISALIGPEGGTIEVTDHSSILYGLKIIFPEGALDKPTLISISIENNSPPLSSEITPLSPVVRFEPEDLYFNVPVEVTFPWGNSSATLNDLVLPLKYSEGESYWYVTCAISIEENAVEIITSHFSHNIIALVDKFSGSTPPEKWDTGFLPLKDGFSIKNVEGVCGGMVAFSKWYFSNHPECTELHNIDQKIQEEIDNKAQLLTKEGGLLTRLITGRRAAFTWEDFLYIVKREMSSSNSPVIMFRLDFNRTPTGQHGLLAYKYEDDKIIYYDPSYPNKEQELTKELYKQRKVDYFVMYGSEVYDPKDFEDLLSEYALEFIDETPKGIISDNRPTISVTVKSLCNDADIHSTYTLRLYLDNLKIDEQKYKCSISSDGTEIIVSYTPESDLALGEHFVRIEAADEQGDVVASYDWIFNCSKSTENIVINWKSTFNSPNTDPVGFCCSAWIEGEWNATIKGKLEIEFKSPDGSMMWRYFSIQDINVEMPVYYHTFSDCPEHPEDCNFLDENYSFAFSSANFDLSFDINQPPGPQDPPYSYITEVSDSQTHKFLIALKNKSTTIVTPKGSTFRSGDDTGFYVLQFMFVDNSQIGFFPIGATFSTPSGYYGFNGGDFLVCLIGTSFTYTFENPSIVGNQYQD